MPSAKRIIADDSIYHIIQKGNNGRTLFEKKLDYQEFLEIIQRYKKEFSFDLYNYCLMNNHLHMLMKVFKKEDLAKLTQALFQNYRIYFKRQYKYTGHLYQGRYKSKIIANDEYLLECARYIETNPLRAKIVTSVKEYKWSSYNYYAYGGKNNLLTPNPLYATFGKNKNTRQKNYRNFVLMPRFYEDIIDKALKI